MFRDFSAEPTALQPGEPVNLLQHQALQLSNGTNFSFPLGFSGSTAAVWRNSSLFAVYTQHMPEEFNLRVVDDSGNTLTPVAEHNFNPAHTHDDSVSSVALEFDGDLDAALFMSVLRRLLQSQGQTLFRSKGIVSIAGDDRRYIFQGVHMLLDDAAGAPWGDSPRTNRLVFIGRELDAELLERLFKACVVAT